MEYCNLTPTPITLKLVVLRISAKLIGVSVSHLKAFGRCRSDASLCAAINKDLERLSHLVNLYPLMLQSFNHPLHELYCLY